MRRRLRMMAEVSWLGAQNAATLKPLAETLPLGALVHPETRDSGGLLGRRNRELQRPQTSPNLDQPVMVRPMLTAANAAATVDPLAETLPLGALVYLEAWDPSGLLEERNRERRPQISPNLDQPVVVRPMLTAANATGGAAR